MQKGLRQLGVAIALVAVGAACGARSGLLEPFQSEAQAGGRGGSGGNGGSRPVGGSGGSFGPGGAFPTAGMPSFSGTPSISGAAGVAGGGEAGMPATCTLSVSDCAGPNEPECAAERAACAGDPEFYETFSSGQGAELTDVATGREGRVVVTGYHEGTTVVADGSIVDPHPNGPQALVASFTNDGELEWLYGDDGDDESRGISVELALNGDTLLQTVRATGVTAASSFVQLNGAGQTSLRENWGDSGFIQPAALGMDNDGRAWSAGYFMDRLNYQTNQLIEGTGAHLGYLLQVNPQLGLLELQAVTPSGSPDAELTALAVDDEDQVLVLGHTLMSNIAFSTFLQKRAIDGSLVFEKRYDPQLSLGSVVVDRNMRPSVFGHFSGNFVNEGERFATKDTGLFVAQYSREGQLLWQKSYDGRAFAHAAAVDPNGNLVLVGYGTQIVLASRTLVSEHIGYSSEPGFAFVLKLRADGTEVWAQNLDGNFGSAAVATDTAGQIWLAGSFDSQVWLGDDGISTNRRTGLLARLSP